MNKVGGKFQSRTGSNGNVGNNNSNNNSCGSGSSSSSAGNMSGAAAVGLPPSRSVHFGVDVEVATTPVQGSPERLAGSREAQLRAEDGSVFGKLSDALLWKVLEFLPTEELIRSSRVSKR